MKTLLILFSMLLQNLHFTTAYDDEANIIGGEDVLINDFPYQVSIRSYGMHICGGSIISVKHILTAAHCINDKIRPPFSYLKIVTSASSTSMGGEFHNIRRIDVHPEYSEGNTFVNDIAIITLFKSMTFNNLQRSVELPSNKTYDFSNGIVTGWGTISFPGHILPHTLQKLNVTVLANEICQEHYNDYIDPVHLCGYSGTEKGICLGDSGSPLVINEKLVAIASSVTPCALGKPDVYTRVFDYLDFIQTITAS